MSRHAGVDNLWAMNCLLEMEGFFFEYAGLVRIIFVDVVKSKACNRDNLHYEQVNLSAGSLVGLVGRK